MAIQQLQFYQTFIDQTQQLQFISRSLVSVDNKYNLVLCIFCRLLCYCILFLFLCFLFYIMYIVKLRTDSAVPTEFPVSVLRSNVSSYVTKCVILLFEGPSDYIRKTHARSICRRLFLFDYISLRCSVFPVSNIVF